MKNFFQWAEEQQYDLEALREQPPAEATGKAPAKNQKTEGSTKRAAVRSHAYPAAYGRGQYPEEYFRPIAADAAVYQSLSKGKD